MHIGSMEITKRIQGMIKDLEGTIQRGEKVMIYGRGKQHNIRLRKCLEKLYSRDQTGRTDKCIFMIVKTTWSKSAQEARTNPKEASSSKERAENKAALPRQARAQDSSEAKTPIKDVRDNRNKLLGQSVK